MESKICNVTCIPGAFEKSVFDGRIFLLEVSEEKIEHRYVYVGGDKICSFGTNDNNYKYISNLGNILTPYIIAVGHENIYFLTPLFKFIKKEKIDETELLKTNKGSVDPYSYHVSNCGKDSFEKLRKKIKFIQIMIIKYSYNFRYKFYK